MPPYIQRRYSLIYLACRIWSREAGNKMTHLRNMVALSLATLAIPMAGPAFAQDAGDKEFDGGNAPQATPVAEPAGATALRDAMRRIAINPQDWNALADAGAASLQLNDANAALNFFTRANGLRLRDARITAGLASAMVRTENPFEALRLFDEAARLGASERSLAADRGLAFDLLGNFGKAQQDYNLARTNGPVSDELVMRQAISLSLAGRPIEADAMLDPLLKRQVQEAWRTRMYLLAARGEYPQSVKIAQDALPAQTAQKMQHYLGLMPNLTRAQQAAAINLGHFPASHQIGRDSEQLQRVASTLPQVELPPAKGEARLIPSGKPLGVPPVVKKTKKQLQEEAKLAEKQRKDREKKEKADLAAAKKKRDDEAKLAEAAKRKGGSKPPVVVATKTPIPEPKPQQPAPQRVAMTNVPVPSNVRANEASVQQPPVETQVVVPDRAVMLQPVETAESAPANASSELAQPGFESLPEAAPADVVVILSPGSSPANVPGPVTSEAPTAEADTEKFDLGAVVASVKVPESQKQPSTVAVDLSTLPGVPKPTPAAPAKPGTEIVTKSSYWVQIATGESRVMSAEFRRNANSRPEAFSGAQGWTSEWKPGSSRLLVGPFKTFGEATTWHKIFTTAGGKGFVWHSKTGQAVTPLGYTAPVRQAAKPEKAPTKAASTGSSKSQPKQASGKTKPTTTKAQAEKPTATGKGRTRSQAAKETPAPTGKKSGKTPTSKQATTPKAKSGSNKPVARTAAKEPATGSSKKQSTIKPSAKGGSAKGGSTKAAAKPDTKAATAKQSTTKKATTKKGK